MLRFSLLITLVIITVGVVVAQELWDPPAVKVFPDHDAVAADSALIPSMLKDGETLFRTRFNRLDGAGRSGATGDSKPTTRSLRIENRFSRISGPDANSCGGCHNQPTTGGAGDFVANVFVGAHFADPPALSVEPKITNERNTLSIFGGGAVEMLAREMTQELRAQRDRGLRTTVAQSRSTAVVLSAKGISFGEMIVRPDGTFDQSGIQGIDHDLVVKPFGVKGVAVSLREFTIGALNQHHGIQADERFGWERTGVLDFDDDGVEHEFSIGQVTALTLFQASLPPLGRLRTSAQTESQADSGERLFSTVGCAACHVPSLTLESRNFIEPNPFNRPGTATPADVSGSISIPIPAGGIGSGIEPTQDGKLRVWLFSDLKRHVICDGDDRFFCNEQRRQDNVPTDQFLTAKLWDAAESAPYGHRGDCDTLSEAILHHSGEAQDSRRRFQRLSDGEKRALIAFLLSLGAAPREHVNAFAKGASK